MGLPLESIVSNAKVIQEFIKHPGMKLLCDKLDKKTDLKRQAWLNAATPEEAELIRQQGRAYAALMGVLNEFLLQGAQAEKALLAPQSNEAVPFGNDASKAR